MKYIHFLFFILIIGCLTVKAAPAIGSIGYTSFSCSSSLRTFTVNISDVSPIATGSLTPRVYYKINTGPYTSASGTLTSGTLNNGIWTFTMTYAVSSNDFVYFFVTAQNALGNIVANPSTGFVATDVNTISSPPAIPFSYYTGTLNGSYTVGTGGSFQTLTNASIAYNTACFLLGPVTFILTDTAYSVLEKFPITFSNHPDASNTNSLLITPLTGTNVNITGNVNATSVLRFLDTKFFTLNGNNGSGNGITIRGAYTGTNTNATVFLAASSAPTLGCKRGSIKQVNVYGAPALAAAGIFAGLDGNFNTGGNHDSIDISFNRVFRASQAIRVFGVNAVTAAIDVLTINSNTVGPATSTPTIDCISDVGINVGKVIGLKLNNNLIQNCLTNGLMTSETLSLSVSDNTIRAISGPSFTFARGMSIGIDTKGGVFKNNFIYDVKNIYPGGFGAQGMYINVGQYSGLRFENNMIYDIKSYAATNYTSWPVGIYLEDAGNIDINNNSVSLSGSNNSTSGATGSSAFLATGSFTTSFFEIKLSNNIFSNTYDHANSSTDVCYSVYSTITASNYTVMNYNDYYVGGTGNNPMLAWKLGINLSNLTSLQSSFGNNLSSYNVAPVFVSPTDLHLVTSANPALDNNGIPIAGLNTDIDYQLRSTTVPDIGADEFVNNSPCTSVLYGNIVTASISACSNTTVPVNFIGGGSGTGFNYQWQVSLNPGGPYTNVIGGVGANTTNYVTPTLTVGVYYYVLQKTCIAASLTSISNEAAVTINPTPNVTASGNSPICSGGNLVLNATTDIGSTNTWIGPSGPIIAPLNWTLFNVSPGMSGNYIFVSSLGSCSAMATVTVLISSPIQLTVSVNPSTICVGSSSTLSAVGATSYTWDAINSQSIVVSPTLSVSYYFLHTNSNGCLDSALVYVYLYPSPVISTSANMICNGQTSTLAISGATSFTWDSGVTTQSIIVTPSITSTYSVTGISQSGCTFSVNETVTVSLCTGIFKDVFSFTNIYILPNPNTGILSIEIPYEGFTIENTQIKIVNVLGQEVKQFNLNNKKQHLNIEELANGVYYLNLIKDNKIIETKKIIKQ